VKIAVVFDSLTPGWEDAEYKKEIAAKKEEEAEYDVARALLAKGHDVQMIGIGDDLNPMLERLAAFQPKVVFNGVEAFRGTARHEYGVAAVLEMHGYRHTGSSPTGLLVARNKSLTKKILTFHGIRVPAFTECKPGEKVVRPSELRFPLIVKPLLEDASIGIAKASVVESDEALVERVKFIHEKFSQAAIVEELIGGREIYAGLVGNDTMQVLPLVGINMGPLLASAGIAGLAIGFGAQTLVKDVINGFFILLENEYNVGDVVQLAGVKGAVESMTMRRTSLRGDDGTVHIVPNSEIKIVSNLTRDWAQVALHISVAYNENSDRIVEFLRQVGAELRHDPRFEEDIVADPEVPGIERVAQGEVDYLMLVRTRPGTQHAVSRELRRRIKECFEKHNVQAGNPARVYVLDNVSAPAK